MTMDFLSPYIYETDTSNIMHYERKPDHIYIYYQWLGTVQFIVCRWNYYNKKKGKMDKIIRPYCYVEHEDGRREWIQKWPLEQRVPYNLYEVPELGTTPNRAIIIHEGEKAVEAGRDLFPDFISICSSGGSNAAHKTDWSCAKGREVYICPDHDESGDSYGKIVKALCKAAGAKKVRIINIEKLGQLK